MACFFSDFGIVHNYFTPSEDKTSYRELRIEKITLSQLFCGSGRHYALRYPLRRFTHFFLLTIFFGLSIIHTAGAAYFWDTFQLIHVSYHDTREHAGDAQNAFVQQQPYNTWRAWGCDVAGSYCVDTPNDHLVAWHPLYALFYYGLEPLRKDKDSQCATPVGNPCNPANGNKHQSEVDLSGLGSGITLNRYYNSFLGYDNKTSLGKNFGFGVGWTSFVGKQLEFYGSIVLVRTASGRAEPFTCLNGACAGDTDTALALTQDATGYTLTRRDNSAERYNLSGKIVSETDMLGKTTSYAYDANSRLYRVTGPFGHTLTFSYDVKNRITTVTEPDPAVVIYYDYDDTYPTPVSATPRGNLTRVRYPNGTAKLYHYEHPFYYNHLTGISYVDASNVATRFSTYAYYYNSSNATDPSNGKAILTQHAQTDNGAPQEKFTLSYDTTTQTTVTDAVGTREVMTFAANLGVKNLVSKVNLTDNKVSAQTFDARNNLTCKQDEEGRVVTYTYNTTNQKFSQTEGQGGNCSAPTPTAATRTTTYQYLSPTLDLPTQIQSPSVYTGSFKTVAIGYSGNLPTSITQSGFTPTGASVSRTVTLGYNANGQVTSIDGPRADVADVTTLAYNNCTTGGGCGQLQRVTNALGHVTSYDSYDANGRLLQMTDPNGVKTVYTYDPRGRVLSITQSAPGGGSRVTTYGYDAAGNVTSTTLPSGLSLTYTYDAAQYLRRVTDSLGNYIDYGYDLKGNRTQTYTYDASGTLVRTVDLAFDARNRVSEINAGGSITKQISDAVGNFTKITDPNTVAVSGTTATNNSYDALNRLFQTVDRLSGSTNYAYDTNDRLRTVQAPNGASTQYQYDDLGNLLQEISPDRGTLSYAYDAAGNLVRQTDARGIVSAYAYDALNRLTFINYGSSVENVTYTYDSASGCTFGLGRLCSVVDESGGTAYAYDAFGNRLVQTHAELGIAYNTFYTYDAGNRVTSITYPDSRVVTYQRDALGRITSVATVVDSAAVTIASARSFRPDGLLLSQSFGNGLNELRQYDTQGRLTYQSLASADTRLYAYDANGNLKGLQSLPLVGSYNYDALDRMSLDQRTTTAATSGTFTYDANGNRLSENLGSYAYFANSNRLNSTPQGGITLDAAGNTLSDGTRSYTYNNAGHLSNAASAGYSYNAQRLRSRKIIGSVGTVYHYDLGGNLIAESDTAGVMRRSYVWADGQALAQIEPVTTLPPDIIVDNSQATFTGTWPTSTSITGFYGANYRTNSKGSGKDKAEWTVNVPTSGTYQVYARWVAASKNASNAPFTVKHSTGSQTIAVNQRTSGGQWMLLGSFTFTAGTTGSVTLTDKAKGTVIADAVKLVATSGGTTSEAVRYLHTDHLQTPRLATNSQAQVIWRWEGNAFGETLANEDVDGDGKLTTINLRFAGQYYDAETGLHYNWNRYYDPKIGRYITSDPIGLYAGVNTYSYVLNNPFFYSDPTGYDVFPVVIINEGGQIGQQGHNNASAVVIGGRKGLISRRYPGSSLPGNPSKCATVASGIYPFTVEYHSVREQTILRIPGNVPVVGGVNPNPNSDSARGRNGAPRGTANGVLNHPSNINTTNDNGLCGCMGIKRDQYEDFISNFLEGDKGTEIVIRLPRITIPSLPGLSDPELSTVIY